MTPANGPQRDEDAGVNIGRNEITRCGRVACGADTQGKAGPLDRREDGVDVASTLAILKELGSPGLHDRVGDGRGSAGVLRPRDGQCRCLAPASVSRNRNGLGCTVSCCCVRDRHGRRPRCTWPRAAALYSTNRILARGSLSPRVARRSMTPSITMPKTSRRTTLNVPHIAGNTAQ